MLNKLKQIKLELYEIKRWIKLTFIYHKMDIQKVDYDAYWKDKRGANMGALSSWQIERANIIFNFLKDQNNISILDIGCGDGNILNYLKNNRKLGVSKIYGADSSDFALSQVKNFGIETIKCDIVDMKSFNLFPNTDYALMLEILEHIPNSEDFLLEIIKKTSRGVFFSIPNTGFIVYRLRLLFGKFPMQWRLHPGEHLRYWTHKDLVFWLNSLGLKNKYTIKIYKGIPLLNKIMPKVFGAGFVVYIKK